MLPMLAVYNLEKASPMTDRDPHCNCPLPYRHQVPEVHEESCPVVADISDRDGVAYRLRGLARRFDFGIEDCDPAEPITIQDTCGEASGWRRLLIEAADLLAAAPSATAPTAPREGMADLAPHWTEHPDGSVTIPASAEDIAAITSHQETRVRELEAALARIVGLERTDDRGYPTANLADAVEIARAVHAGCLARAIPPTPVAVLRLSRGEMLAKWHKELATARDAWRLDSATLGILELAALAFGEAIQRHFMGGTK